MAEEPRNESLNAQRDELGSLLETGRDGERGNPIGGTFVGCFIPHPNPTTYYNLKLFMGGANDLRQLKL